MEAKEDHSCCEKLDFDYDVKVSEDCCLNEVEVLQIGTDLLNHDGNIEFVGISALGFDTPAVIGASEEPKVQIANNSPPFTLSTLERLSNLQVYVI